MSKIFVTGACGFLASHLIEALIKDGNEVIGNDTLICGDEYNANCEWHNVDCRNYDKLKDIMVSFKPDVVVHTAALAHEGLSSFSPYFISSSIHEASVSTFSAAIASGVKRIVYMSSMSRYGAGPMAFVPTGGGTGPNATFTVQRLNPPFKESYEPAPVDPYAVAKVAAEDTLKILCDTHGVAWSILVPHNIIGVRQRYCDPFRNVASIMINRCLQGKGPIVYGDGQQTRCFSPVADCIPSIVKAVYGAADGEIINIGPDKGEITIGRLASKIIALTKSEEPIVFFPDRPNEVKHAYCSSDKARRILGYEEKQSIDDCLAEMVADIRRRGTKEFVYDFPLEIVTDRTPDTWKKKLI